MRRLRDALSWLCPIACFIVADADYTTARADDNKKYTFDIYGFAQGDLIYDSQRMDPNWIDAFRPSKIAVPEGEFGSPGQSSVSVKQSRFGVSGTEPTDAGYGPINFKFEFDLFGVGADQGQTTFRLRHAYAEWGPLLAGQTHSLFMDIEDFPNVIDYWGPPGLVFARTPQLRLTPYRTEHSQFAFAFERPGNDVDIGQLQDVDPELGNNIENDQKYPDFTMHYYYGDNRGHAQIAGILRGDGFDALGTPGNNPKQTKLGWGVNASGHVNLFEKDRLIGQIVHGDGIANDMNDGGVDLAPGGVIGHAHAVAQPLTGVVGYYERTWNDCLSSAFGYSFTQVHNTSLQLPDAFQKGQYASINLLFTPTKNIMIGGEILWGERTNDDRENGRDIRFQFSIKYSWDKSFAI